MRRGSITADNLKITNQRGMKLDTLKRGKIKVHSRKIWLINLHIIYCVVIAKLEGHFGNLIVGLRIIKIRYFF